MFTYRTIVVGIDFSLRSEIGLRAAAGLANRTGAKRLHLVHVIDRSASSARWRLGSYSVGDGRIQARDTVQKMAEKRLREVEVSPTDAEITREVRLGAPAQELTRAGVESRADLMVLASHDRSGMARMVLGSVSGSLVRAAHCPVLVVGQDRPGSMPFHRILAGVDLSPVSERVLAHAVSLASPDHGFVHALSIWEPPPLALEDEPWYITHLQDPRLSQAHHARVSALVDRVRVPDVDVAVEVMTRSLPARGLLDVARTVAPDLIVVGTSGHNAWHRFFLGSTATRIVLHAPCPVLVVPHDAPEAREILDDSPIEEVNHPHLEPRARSR